MKRKIVLAVLLSSSFSLPSFAAPSCKADLPASARYAIAYLSYLERGGTNYAEPFDRSGRTPDEICAELQSVTLEASRTRPGYTQVSLHLAGQTCSMDVKVAADGRVAHSEPMTCGVNAQ